MKINDGYRSNYDLVLKNISKQKGRKIMVIEQNMDLKYDIWIT